MPLRDHFRMPVWKQASWEGFHGLWPGMMVIQLSGKLPENFTAEPRIKLGNEYAYEVLIFDQSQARQFVAAIEIVSPGNKDWPESRRAFVSKCSALLQQRVCVSIIDLVTTRNFNLYGELMEQAGQADPLFSPTSPATYAVTCRGHKVQDRPRFEVWAYALNVGEVLPTLPIWLGEDLAVSLDLEASYEETCRVLRIQ